MRKKDAGAVPEAEADSARVDKVLLRCNRQNHYIVFDGRHLKTPHHENIEGDEATLVELGGYESCRCLEALWAWRRLGRRSECSKQSQRAFDAKRRPRIPRKLLDVWGERCSSRNVARWFRRKLHSWRGRLDLELPLRWASRVHNVFDAVLSAAKLKSFMRRWPRRLDCVYTDKWEMGAATFKYEERENTRYSHPLTMSLLYINLKWLRNDFNGHHLWVEWVTYQDGNKTRRRKLKAAVLQVRELAAGQWEVTVLRRKSEGPGQPDRPVVESFVINDLNKGMRRVKTP